MNSALQRARASLRAAFPGGIPAYVATPARTERALLDEYVRCWEAGDLDGLARLLTDDVTLNMPPSFDWYSGREAVIEFFRWAWSHEAALGPFRLLVTSGNGQPAVALYGRDAASPRLSALALEVLTVRDGLVAEIAGFVSPSTFPRFGVPLNLDV